MISFDVGNNNLNNVWNEINSIKSDTYSMWNFISTLTGVDIDSSILSSISSLSSDLGSVISDTGSLNMDVVSLYNICSSLSDSISTISGGSPYYVALSDAITKSLSYVYNMTGDLTAFPTYDSFTFHGNIANFNNLSITIKNFDIGNIDLASGLTITTSITSDKFKCIKLSGKTLTADDFKNISTLKLDFNDIESCTFYNILNLSMNNYSLVQNSLSNCCNTIFCKNITSNTFSAGSGYIYGNILSKNSFIRNLQSINAFSLYSNTFDSISIYNLDCKYFKANSFNCGPGNLYSYCTPNFICSDFYDNTIQDVLNDFNIECLNYSGNSITNITLLGTSTINTSRMINIKANEIYRNKISNVWNVNVDCLRLLGNWSLNNVHSLKFKAESVNWAGGHGDSGGMNSMANIDCLDLREITSGFSIHYYNGNYLGIGTLKINYNVSWTNPVYLTSGTELQPSNIYTLDFYNCESAIGGSIFTIPGYYSGYDEGNVWISGKPLTEYSYTLSVSS